MKLLATVVLVVLCLGLAGSVSYGAELSSKDVNYIANIITELDSYVVWPEGKSLEGKGDLLVITAIGESPLYDELKKFNMKKTDEKRTIKFRQVEPDWMPANSHVLIFSGLDSERTRKLIGLLHDKGSLTVTLGEGNSALGSVMNFVGSNAEHDARIELNSEAAEEEGFAFETTLLDKASVVEK